MDSINKHLTDAGSYQGLRERASQDSRPGIVNEAEVPADHPVWDAWDAIKATWPGPTMNWEPEPPIAWLHAVSELTREQIGNGVRNLIHFEGKDGSKSFPPSAGEFHDLCLNNFEWERRCHKPIDPATLIEHKRHQTPGAQQAAREAMAEMRGLFSLATRTRE